MTLVLSCAAYCLDWISEETERDEVRAREELRREPRLSGYVAHVEGTEICP